MKVLVAIANHGTGNRAYLDRLISEYRAAPFDSHIVVLSNIPKDLGPGLEVRVGVPSSNPWSLPFAHRPLFRERAEEYDLFIYSEDDTLIRGDTLAAFVAAESVLEPKEIAGFIRTETSQQGSTFFSSVHSHFHWLPGSVVARGGRLFAQFSNDHSGCFVLSRRQLRHCLDSGGFGDAPHEGRHDMLCSAATDPYSRCGLTRLVSIDEIDRFITPHLPNKYIGRMGAPADSVRTQLEALRDVHRGVLPPHTLMRVETTLPRERYSKSYYEKPDPRFPGEFAVKGEVVLSIGVGDGALEKPLIDKGCRVVGIPLDAVIGRCAERSGVELVHSPLNELDSRVNGLRPDLVLISNLLHLTPEPEQLLTVVRSLMKPGARLVARVPNLMHAGAQRRRFRGDPGFADIGNYGKTRCHAAGRGWLRRALERSGYSIADWPATNLTGKAASFPGFVRRAARTWLEPEIRVIARPR